MKRCSFDFFPCGSCRHPEFMVRDKGRFSMMDFPSYVGLIKHPEEGLILFDTGYDVAFFEATNYFPERFYRWTTPVSLNQEETVTAWLEKLGHKKEDVKAVIISHFHGDHVAGLHHFPRAKIFCAKAGLSQIRMGSRLGRVRQGLLSGLIPQDVENRIVYFEDCTGITLPSDFYPFIESVDLLNDGSLLAVELPGHCPGHWGLALRTEKDQYTFLIADASWSIDSIENHIAPPRITTSLLGNTKRYRETLLNLHQLSKEKTKTAILPSHCPIAAKRFGSSQ